MKLFERFARKTVAPSQSVQQPDQKSPATEVKPEATDTAPPEDGRSKWVLFVGRDASSFQPIQTAFQRSHAIWKTQSVGSLADGARLLQTASFHVLVCDGAALAAADAATFERVSNTESAPFLIRWGNVSEAPVPTAKLRFEALDMGSSVEEIHATFEKIFRLGDWMTDPDVSKLVKRMDRIPTMPALYKQVTAELSSNSGSLEFAGKLIGKDPGMTLRVLQMINSSEFGMARSITDPVEAVLYLGSERVKAMMLAANAFQQFESDTCPGFSHPALWQHSVTTASFASTVTRAHTSEKKLTDAAFTAGLLHDVGRLLLAGNIPTEYTKVLEQANRRKVSLAQVELEAFGATHAELGACVLGSWGLPLPVLESVAWHHVPARSEDQGFTLLTAVHLANSFENERQEEKEGLRRNHVDKEYIERLELLDKCNVWRNLCGCTSRCNVDERLQRIAIRHELKNLPK